MWAAPYWPLLLPGLLLLTGLLRVGASCGPIGTCGVHGCESRMGAAERSNGRTGATYQVVSRGGVVTLP